MNTGKERFTLLIEEIVYAEMDRGQQTEYELEGKDLIDRLFGEKSLEEDHTLDDNGIFIGITSDTINLIGVATGFGSLIISCISLYLDLKKNSDQHLIQEVEKIEAIRKLRDHMKDQQMSVELIDKINERYSSKIIDTLISLL